MPRPFYGDVLSKTFKNLIILNNKRLTDNVCQKKKKADVLALMSLHTATLVPSFIGYYMAHYNCYSL